MKSLRIEELKSLSLAVLLIAAATFTACSSADSIAEEPVQQPENPAKKTYTMTVTASKGGDDSALARAMADAGLTGDAQTRALTLGTDSETGKPTLSATWKTGETVKVYSNGQEIGTLTAQTDGAETTLSGTLDEAPTQGQDILLYFPKFPYVYTGQKGTLADIAQNFDYAGATIAAADWDFDGDKITTASTVDFTNQQAIVKFTLVDKADGKTALDASSLTLHRKTGWLLQTYNPFDFYSSTTGDITITPEEPTSEIWVSMIAMYLTNFTLTATVGTDTYIYERTSEVTFTPGQFYSITVKMDLMDDVNLSSVSRDMTLDNGATLTGTLSSNYKLTIADGATVTLDGATIIGTNNESYQWAGLNCLGDATIVLADGSVNSVKGFHRYYPGIHVAPGHTLTIQGTGSLTATSNGYGAGIGSGFKIDCGNIVIAGGNITANGQSDAAGIGGGQNATCGAITISGGTVKATTINGGAGIGSGTFGSCGAITISGTASVTATGDQYGAGIGSGQSASCGTITISGGNVSATGGKLAPGIGSGTNSASCNGVIITTGVTSVTATKGYNETTDNTPYSIGSGQYSTCGTVTIGCTLDGEGNPVGGTVGMVTTSPYTYTPGNQ